MRYISLIMLFVNLLLSPQNTQPRIFQPPCAASVQATGISVVPLPANLVGYAGPTDIPGPDDQAGGVVAHAWDNHGVPTLSLGSVIHGSVHVESLSDTIRAYYFDIVFRINNSCSEDPSQVYRLQHEFSCPQTASLRGEQGYRRVVGGLLVDCLAKLTAKILNVPLGAVNPII